SLLTLKNFYEWDGNQPQARIIDNNIKHNLALDEELAQAVIAASQNPVSNSKLDNKERIAGIQQVAKLLEGDLILFRSLDLSKKEERGRLANKMLGHLDLLRQAIRAGRDLPAQDLLPQIQNLAALTLSFKPFTTDKDPIIRKEDFEAALQAVTQVGIELADNNPCLFYIGFSESDQDVIAKIKSLGLSSHIERGILGYCSDRNAQPADARDEGLTDADWKAIEEIQAKTALTGANPDFPIEQYLIQAGKFRPLTDQESNLQAAACQDFKQQLETSLKEGKSEFLTNLTPTSLRQFVRRDAESHLTWQEAKQEINFEKRLEKLGIAAQKFADLGIKSRVEEVLRPVIQYAEAIKDPVQRGEWLLKIAHFYESAGMEERAKAYYETVSKMGPRTSSEGGPDPLHQMALYSLGMLELLKEKPCTDEAKLLFSEIREFPPAKQKLEAIDRDQHQRWIGVPYSLLTGVLMGKVDASQKVGGGGYALELERKDEQFRIQAQSFLNELARLCQPGGECKTVHQALRKLKDDSHYTDVFVLLERSKSGKVILSCIQTLSNPALTDKQMAGEMLRLAEECLDMEDFDRAMDVSRVLKDNPYVTEQAKVLIDSRIPDAVKWKAQKEAIWAGIKDILIVPAIVEGRYGDAAISFFSTVATFGVGKIATTGAKLGWAAWSMRSLQVGGRVSQFAARFAAMLPRVHRWVGTALEGMIADNLGNVAGGRAFNYLIGRENHLGFWNEFLLGMAPFGTVHAQGVVLKNLGKRAEHVGLLKAVNAAEAAMLKGQGKLALRGSARFGFGVTQQAMTAVSFSVGDLINEGIGLAEAKKTPFCWRSLEKVPMSFQQLYGIRSVNFLTGGRLQRSDHHSDQRLKVAHALAKLQMKPPRDRQLNPVEKQTLLAQHQAMEAYLVQYSEARAAQQKRPLLPEELGEETARLNESALKLLHSVGLESGPIFEAARMNLFTMAAQAGFATEIPPHEILAAYAKHLPEGKTLDGAVAKILASKKSTAEDRDSLKAVLLTWAMQNSENPEQFGKHIERLEKLSPKIGEFLQKSVEGLLGEKALETETGQKLAEYFLLHSLSVSENPNELGLMLATFSKEVVPKLNDGIERLLAAGGLEGAEARLAMAELVIEKGFSLPSLEIFIQEVSEGKIDLKFDGKKITAQVVPEEQYAKRREQAAKAPTEAENPTPATEAPANGEKQSVKEGQPGASTPQITAPDSIAQSVQSGAAKAPATKAPKAAKKPARGGGGSKVSGRQAQPMQRSRPIRNAEVPGKDAEGGKSRGTASRKPTPTAKDSAPANQPSPASPVADPAATPGVETPYGRAYQAFDPTNKIVQDYHLFPNPDASVQARRPEGVEVVVKQVCWVPEENGIPARIKVFLRKTGPEHQSRQFVPVELSVEAARKLGIPIEEQNLEWAPVQNGPKLFLATDRAANADPHAADAMHEFDGMRDRLLTKLLAQGDKSRARGRGRVEYKADRIEQLLYEVLQHQGSLDALPTELRDLVRDYMEKVIAKAQELFPEEHLETVKRNPFTGENLTDREALYRLARMLLNQRSGRPIFAKPGPAETKNLVDFVKGPLEESGVKNYAEAQAALRNKLFSMSAKDLEDLFKGIDIPTRDLVVDALFGDGDTLRIKDPGQAMALAQSLGKLGLTRELGVILDLSGEAPHVVLQRGDVSSVTLGRRRFIWMHTHSVGENAVPSREDIAHFVEDAQRLHEISRLNPSLKLPLYDPKTGTYQNWVQGETGIAQVTIKLNSEGKPEQISMQLGFYGDAPVSNSSHQKVEDLKKAVLDELKLPLNEGPPVKNPKEIEKALKNSAQQLAPKTDAASPPRKPPRMRVPAPPIEQDRTVRGNGDRNGAPATLYQHTLRVPPGQNEFTVGRHADVSFDGDPDMSRTHATFHKTVGTDSDGKPVVQWWVFDGGSDNKGEYASSTHGTWIRDSNGQWSRLPQGQKADWMPVFPGQVLRMGNTEFTFQPSAAPNEPTIIPPAEEPTIVQPMEPTIVQPPESASPQTRPAHPDRTAVPAGPSTPRPTDHPQVDTTQGGAESMPALEMHLFYDNQLGPYHVAGTPPNTVTVIPGTDGHWYIFDGSLVLPNREWRSSEKGVWVWNDHQNNAVRLEPGSQGQSGRGQRVMPGQKVNINGQWIVFNPHTLAEAPPAVPATTAPSRPVSRASSPTFAAVEGSSGNNVRILAGTVDFSLTVPFHSDPATQANGTVAQVTTQGIGYGKGVNEDVAVRIRHPDGRVLMVSIDGMGGMGHGDIAALLAAQAISTGYLKYGNTAAAWQLANKAIKRFNGALRELAENNPGLDSAQLV
ncbi:MAG TPA: hypothetical protein DF383_08130, partial [Deltaproteobacteria bacterium]|nr:hypothetical protein [Deltaproteobacteria bacterium]